MITKEMKVLDVLNKYPETLEVFIQVSPHFKKLQNKILRKALASRVTIEQAAKIANVDLKNLLYELNKKINKDFSTLLIKANISQEDNKTLNKPDFLNNIPSDKIVKLDVRPILNQGLDPFMNIMNASNQLKEDEILLLINSFEPIPLYTVLGKKGFDHWTEKVDDAFHVYFFRRKEDEISKSEELSEEKNSADLNFEKIIEIDVRELPPPEPMIKILETLSQIDEQTFLLVHHHREPMMLYPKLEERGFEAITNKINDNYYKVLIMKKRN